MKVGQKVKRVHPTTKDSQIQVGKIYTVSCVDKKRISLSEVDTRNFFLIEAFEIVTNQ